MVEEDALMSLVEMVPDAVSPSSMLSVVPRISGLVETIVGPPVSVSVFDPAPSATGVAVAGSSQGYWASRADGVVGSGAG